MIYDNHEIEQFYLVQALEKSFFIAYMQTPTKDYTIDQYKQWEREYVKSAICINRSFPPQMFRNSDIKECIAINNIVQEILGETGIKGEDIIMPFIGGIFGFDFRELIKTLWNEESEDFWGYRRRIKEYHKKLIDKIGK